MTTGEKLTKLRREHGYTQEEIAEQLGVSRQAVSKWEANTAYPETDKLIWLAQLYDCSLDYLLNDANAVPRTGARTPWHFERKSARTVRGVPLWHINLGMGRTAKGIFAVGFAAKGVFSAGLFSMGVVSAGVFSLGVLAFGSFALGLFSFGAIALGLLIAAGAVAAGVVALGALAFGVVAIGASAFGSFSVGALAVGNYFALGDTARAAIAIGKTRAVGTLLSAAEVTEAVRAQIVSLLDQTVPAALGWAKRIIRLFL